MSNRKPFNPRAYEGFRGAVELPRSIRTYFDSFAHEYKSIDKDQKLLDLGYVLLRGYDLEAQIKACLYDRPHIGELEFKWALGALIEHADPDYMSINGYTRDVHEYSLDTLVGILRNILDDHYIEYADQTRELV